ncbi:MAG TPA: flagellar protein FlgN [Clostridiaceae bacterium]|nr:flagellar protein FlgN [Clostridiaceae bacterium]
MEPKDYVLKMKDISIKKLTLLDEIFLFARSQNEVIKDKRFEEMDLLIREKQQRIEAVDKLDEQFAECSSKLREMLSVKSLEELPRFNLPGTKELREVIESIFQKLKDIREIDDENISLVKAEMKDIKKKLNGVSNNKRIQGAYNPPMNMTSHFFDQKK